MSGCVGGDSWIGEEVLMGVGEDVSDIVGMFW